MATKFETKLAITQLAWQISPRSLHLTGGFGVGLFNDVSQILPQPTLVAMATKFELKFAITRLICEISPRFLRLAGGFRGWAIERCQSNSSATEPGCHGNEMWVNIGYNSACMRDMSKILASTWGFCGVGLFNDVSRILPRPTLVAMATNF